MAINLSDNIKTNAPKHGDSRYLNNLSPWISTAEANSGITTALRFTGLTVNVLGEEYWYKNGIGNNDLIVKCNTSGTTYTFSNGLISIGTDVQLGGTLTGNTIIGGDYMLNLSGGTLGASKLKITSGATDGYILTSDAVGNATWQSGSTHDNLYLKLNQTTPQLVTGGTPSFDAINLNTGYTKTGSEVVGTRYWDADEHTTSLVLENGVRLQDGKEFHSYGKNVSGIVIADGQPVSIASAAGQFTAFDVVDITTENAFAYIGIATETIPVNGFGHVTTAGVVNDINTLHLLEGRAAFIDVSGNTSVLPPPLSNYVIVVGNVERVHASNGRINITKIFLPKLKDLSDINGTALDSNGQIPVWDNDSGYFDFDYNINNYTPKINDIVYPNSFTVSGLPAASGSTGGFAYVSNESSGAQMAFSDGSDWRRFTDRAVVT